MVGTVILKGALSPKCLMVLTIVLALVIQSQAYPRCIVSRFRNSKQDVNKDDCKYGWEVDSCGETVCTKGPGEVCGGRFQIYGICGEGLMCSNCGRCHGCSFKTFECYDDPKCVWSN
ncbi:hypothetical protein TCAL_13025 [Tigriopus californicus]|uniref:Neuroparsin n=1 Tax=Tigriopus californicus TaxID=6832 RepID=A0A553P1I1_TIGCA|nr:hypothetical protein TCAL_13025 [Tigriopus californicus]|eukprot:TCALIF_13025-PA protein Name:"Similar to Neuroparsin-A (Locusta migratoria)" AED:0.08 eAED:0.08 QI:0/-1/0/1/-1/1/1/0/116